SRPVALKSLFGPGSRPPLASTPGAARSQPSVITRRGRSISFDGPASAEAALAEAAADPLAIAAAEPDAAGLPAGGGGGEGGGAVGGGGGGWRGNRCSALGGGRRWQARRGRPGPSRA